MTAGCVTMAGCAMTAGCAETIARLQNGAYHQELARLYPRRPLPECCARYIRAIESFVELFGERQIILMTAPGRVEIGGNHTDHQSGRVLAAAIDLDVLCVASPTDDSVARVHSFGHEPDVADLRVLTPLAEEQGHSTALVRGIAAWFRDRGHPVGGFCAYTTSDLPSGSGLSSSAAFEVAIGGLFRALYGAQLRDLDLALAGQFAENTYYGKPCGLMDQTASALGGLLQIDFADPDAPEAKKIPLQRALHGYNLCVVRTGGSHDDLTHDYATITQEMGRVAEFFGKTVLREVDSRAFFAQIPALRRLLGDRPVLRAMHFFADDALVPRQADALAREDTEAFLSSIVQSGLSSFTYLQNVFSPAAPQAQSLSLALALSQMLLAGQGAWRVHGGGFAGSILAIVPESLYSTYRARMDEVFGPDACLSVSIRQPGVCAPFGELNHNGQTG